MYSIGKKKVKVKEGVKGSVEGKKVKDKGEKGEI